MLLDCAEEGFRILDRYITYNDVNRYFSSPLIPDQTGKPIQYEKYLYSNNVDLFYSFISVLYATDDKRVIDEVIGCKDAKADLARALDYIEQALYQESPFERDLVYCVDKYTSQSDEEIKAAFSAKFDVTSLNLLDLPTDRPVYFAKVNHGLWEFIRGAYDDAREQRKQFREINIRYILREARTSGITQLWGRLINRYLMPTQLGSPKGTTFFCVSLTAGIELPSQSVGKDLNPVTRGAAIGLLSTFDAALPRLSQYHLGDGGSTRLLVSGKQLEEFFDKYVADAEACLFLTPPHLKMIDFVSYKGDVYKFLVPPSKINNAWKAVVATFIGYLSKLSGKYRTITILAQGASIASSIALLIAEIEAEFPNTKLRFFDLGRVLDVTTPETLKKQAWATRYQDDYISEGSKVFCNAASSDFVFATPV